MPKPPGQVYGDTLLNSLQQFHQRLGQANQQPIRRNRFKRSTELGHRSASENEQDPLHGDLGLRSPRYPQSFIKLPRLSANNDDSDFLHGNLDSRPTLYYAGLNPED